MSNVDQVFADINGRLTPERAKKINATYQFDIGGDGGGKWFADLTKDTGPWIEKKEAEAQCTITVANAEDWVSIAGGKINPTMAFMQKKLQVKGNMGLAMKLQALLAA